MTRERHLPFTAAAWYRPAMVAASLAFLMLLAIDLAAVAARWGEVSDGVGTDFFLYREATRRWLAGGPFYAEFQLAGPYIPWGRPSILYPPTSLLLFIPFTVLPAIMRWAVPIGIVVAVIAYHRPRPVAWPVLAMCLWFPTTAEVVIRGEPGPLGGRRGGARHRLAFTAGVLVLLKPTLVPFALVGCRHRSWWVGLGVLALVSVPFAAMWLDYVTVVQNARDPNGLMYSLNQVPTVMIPVVAWAREQQVGRSDIGQGAGIGLAIHSAIPRHPTPELELVDLVVRAQVHQEGLLAHPPDHDPQAIVHEECPVVGQLALELVGAEQRIKQVRPREFGAVPHAAWMPVGPGASSPGGGTG